jgi:hypothetical protein
LVQSEHRALVNDTLVVDYRYPSDKVPQQDCSFLEETRDEQEREYTTLTCQQQALLLWDIFSLLNKVAYYKTLLDCADLPLLHALADFPVFYRDQDGMNWSQCPSKALQAAIRMHPEELLKPDTKGNLPLHLAAKRDEP